MARVMFSVPPVNTKQGQAQATQNRQYQYFKDETYIFPVIPATFLTMIKDEPGNESALIDGIAEQLSEAEYYKLLFDMKPDYIIYEANTMVVRKYYEVIAKVKQMLPNVKVMLAGEHVTAMPEECKKNCNADFFLSGGKWYYEAFKIIVGRDFNMVLKAEVTPGQKVWETIQRPLPHIDRILARWWLYAYNNGNFKFTPATYTMAAQDCWYRPKHKDGKAADCSFCTWTFYHPENKIRPVDDFIAEIKGLVNFGFKEFFDDSGTFPVGSWLKEFCAKMTEKKYDAMGKKVALSDLIVWGCNMRFKALQPDDFKMMADAGCRFILWGFESANQKTLDQLRKGYDISAVKQNLIHARVAGIWNHLTVMMGYPWETLEEERATFKMVKWLLVNDWAASMQATMFMPYPGTYSFQQAKENGWLIHEDWNNWDMSKPVLKLKYNPDEVLKLMKDYYNIGKHPKFVFDKLMKIRTIDDVKQYARLAKKVFNRFEYVENATIG